MLFGEAPGPRGADQSGLPFWGDAAGVPVYRALQAAGMAQLPLGAFENWDGAFLREAGLVPRLQGVALSNAYPRCPTRDGIRFRAPTDIELRSPENRRRVLEELKRASRPEQPLRVLALGRRAGWLLQQLQGPLPFSLQILPHPSAQGLLQAAPGRGKGLRLADLREAWEARLVTLLLQRGD
jgi:uracil-DNA glycosylase